LTKILLTGANGFIARELSVKLTDKKFKLVLAVRQRSSFFSKSALQVEVGDLTSDTDWSEPLDSVSVVIHTAARVHVMNDSALDPLTEFRRVNLEGTVNLAKQAAEAGVKRFIFLSSIKVNGEATKVGTPFTADDVPAPRDAYGISKAETEQALLDLSAATDMEVVIVRPVLVYGPNVKANFLDMMHWLSKGIPLPFGAINNKRSLIALDNLVDLIITCVDHPAAANQIFLASDGEDISTTELLQKISLSLKQKPRLIPVSSKVLCMVAGLIGKRGLARRLIGSLQVDITKTKNVLNWHPPLNLDDALKKTVQSFLQQQKK